MKRRALVIAVAWLCSALYLPAPRAHEPAPRRLGILATHQDGVFIEPGMREAILDALGKLGYVRGRNLELEERYANNDLERLPELARQLVQARVDAILTVSTPPTLAAQQATRTVPIVTNVGDPVGSGFARDLKRPGGNVTGLSQNRRELFRKEIELVRLLLPRTRAVAILVDESLKAARTFAALLVEAAAEASIATEVIPIDSGTLEARMREAKARGLEAAFYFGRDGAAAVAAAMRHRVAAFGGSCPRVETGELACVDDTTDPRQMAAMVAKVLGGANPAEMPFLSTNRYVIHVNARTAARLGIAIPPEVRLRADRVIE